MVIHNSASDSITQWAHLHETLHRYSDAVLAVTRHDADATAP